MKITKLDVHHFGYYNEEWIGFRSEICHIEKPNRVPNFHRPELARKLLD